MKTYPIFFLFFFSSFFIFGVVRNGYSNFDYSLVPCPQFLLDEGFDIKLNKNWAIVTPPNQDELESSLKWLSEVFVKNHSLKLKQVNYESAQASDRIVLGCIEDNDFINTILSRSNIKIPEKLGPQGYVIKMFKKDPREIVIAAHTPQGIFYGVQTFQKLISGDIVKGMTIIDFPDFQFRAIMDYPGDSYMGKNNPKFTIANKKAIDRFSQLKINALFHYSRDHFFQTSPEYIYAYKKMSDYCKERFIDYIPNIGSLRRCAYLPFNMIEGWWVHDELFTVGQDNVLEPKHPFSNLLMNGDFLLDQNRDDVPDGWKINDKAIITLNLDGRFKSQLIINRGIVKREFVVEKNKHYCVTGNGKGNYPILSLRAVSKDGNSLFRQFDSKRKFYSDWRKLGVTLKTTTETEKIVIELFGKKGPVSFSNIRLYRLDGSLKNVIRSNNTDIEVSNAAGTVKYSEGKDYKVFSGETSKRFNPEMQAFRIERKEDGRIEPGQTVKISYDALYAWSFTKWHNQPPCVSEPSLYTDFYYPAIDRVIDSLHPKFIHFASDEIRGFNRDSRNIKRGLTNAELFSEWINKIAGYVKQRDPKCGVIIWGDMVSPFHNGGDEFFQLQYGGSPGRMAEAVENKMIDKDVIINGWWYHDKWTSAISASIDFFNSTGHKFIGSPWYEEQTIKNWSQMLYGKSNALGGMITNWKHRTWAVQDHYSEFANSFWNTRYKEIFYSGFDKDEDENGVPDKWSIVYPHETMYGEKEKRLRSRVHLSGKKIAHGPIASSVPGRAVLLQGANYYLESEYIKIYPQKAYKISLYVRRKARTGNESPRIIITWFNDNKIKLSEIHRKIQSVKSTYIFNELEVASPQSAKYAKIQLRGQDEGKESFLIDTFSIKKRKCVDENKFANTGIH